MSSGIPDNWLLLLLCFLSSSGVLEGLILDEVPSFEFGAQRDLFELVIDFVEVELYLAHFQFLLLFLQLFVFYSFFEPANLLREVFLLDLLFEKSDLLLLLHGMDHHFPLGQIPIIVRAGHLLVLGDHVEYLRIAQLDLVLLCLRLHEHQLFRGNFLVLPIVAIKFFLKR